MARRVRYGSPACVGLRTPPRLARRGSVPAAWTLVTPRHGLRRRPRRRLIRRRRRLPLRSTLGTAARARPHRRNRYALSASRRRARGLRRLPARWVVRPCESCLPLQRDWRRASSGREARASPAPLLGPALRQLAQRAAAPEAERRAAARAWLTQSRRLRPRLVLYRALTWQLRKSRRSRRRCHRGPSPRRPHVRGEASARQPRLSGACQTECRHVSVSSASFPTSRPKCSYFVLVRGGKCTSLCSLTSQLTMFCILGLLMSASRARTLSSSRRLFMLNEVRRRKTSSCHHLVIISI